MEPCGGVLLLFSFVAATLILIKVNSLGNAVRRLEEKLDALLYDDEGEGFELAIRKARRLLQLGLRIEAIKTYRIYTGASEADAEAVINGLQQAESAPRGKTGDGDEGLFREGQPPKP
jgi:hypothetical protein